MRKTKFTSGMKSWKFSNSKLENIILTVKLQKIRTFNKDNELSLAWVQLLLLLFSNKARNKIHHYPWHLLHGSNHKDGGPRHSSEVLGPHGQWTGTKVTPFLVTSHLILHQHHITPNTGNVKTLLMSLHIKTRLGNLYYTLNIKIQKLSSQCSIF